MDLGNLVSRHQVSHLHDRVSTQVVTVHITFPLFSDPLVDLSQPLPVPFIHLFLPGQNRKLLTFEGH